MLAGQGHFIQENLVINLIIEITSLLRTDLGRSILEKDSNYIDRVARFYASFYKIIGQLQLEHSIMHYKKNYIIFFNAEEKK